MPFTTLDQKERDDLLALAERVGENPTEGLWALEERQAKRRWGALPLSTRIFRTVAAWFS